MWSSPDILPIPTPRRYVYWVVTKTPGTCYCSVLKSVTVAYLDENFIVKVPVILGCLRWEVFCFGHIQSNRRMPLDQTDLSNNIWFSRKKNKQIKVPASPPSSQKSYMLECNNQISNLKKLLYLSVRTSEFCWKLVQFHKNVLYPFEFDWAGRTILINQFFLHERSHSWLRVVTSSQEPITWAPALVQTG